MAKGTKRRQEEKVEDEELKKKVKINEPEESESESGSDSEREEESGSDSDQIEDDLSDVENDEFELESEEEEEGEQEEGDEEDEEEGSESEDEDEEEQPAAKQKKNQKQSFSKAINAILSSKVKAHDRDDPILVRSKKTAKEIEATKLEMKAKRAINMEKRMLKDKDRVKDILPKSEENAREVLEHEKKLKQIAQKGVVRLFNAIQAAQAKPNDKKSVGVTKQQEQVNEMSKEKFLDLIRAGGK